jgi:hypothetical protein
LISFGSRDHYSMMNLSAGFAALGESEGAAILTDSLCNPYVTFQPGIFLA